MPSVLTWTASGWTAGEPPRGPMLSVMVQGAVAVLRFSPISPGARGVLLMGQEPVAPAAGPGAGAGGWGFEVDVESEARALASWCSLVGAGCEADELCDIVRESSSGSGRGLTRDSLEALASCLGVGPLPEALVAAVPES